MVEKWWFCSYGDYLNAHGINSPSPSFKSSAITNFKWMCNTTRTSLCRTVFFRQLCSLICQESYFQHSSLHSFIHAFIHLFNKYLWSSRFWKHCSRLWKYCCEENIAPPVVKCIFYLTINKHVIIGQGLWRISRIKKQEILRVQIRLDYQRSLWIIEEDMGLSKQEAFQTEGAVNKLQFQLNLEQSAV